MATLDETCAQLNELPARIWRYYEMNGMPFATVTLAPARAVDVTITEDTLTVDLEDGRTISVPIVWFPRLAYGSPEERANFTIAGAGYGIHWPDLDEDIGVEGLLLGKKSMESQASFERWLEGRKQAQQREHE